MAEGLGKKASDKDTPTVIPWKINGVQNAKKNS